MKNNKLIIISGPTACGKTNTSIELAFKIENLLNQKVTIVNFDSLLFYKELSIGTAKPTMEERKGIRHELVDIVSINSPLNASDFIELAINEINAAFLRKETVILVGGSAFYLRALLKGMYTEDSDIKRTDKDIIRQELNELYSQKGIFPFIDFLKTHDPESLQVLHENDHYRLMRAVEYFKITGSKISDQKKLSDQNAPYDFSQNRFNWDVIHFYLDLPRPTHQKIIETRTKKMVQDGLVTEVEAILKNGYDKNLRPLSSIGYFETIAYLEGKYPTMEECYERIVISTRQLAKSQRTFFKKITPKHAMNPLTDLEKITNLTFDFLKVD